MDDPSTDLLEHLRGLPEWMDVKAPAGQLAEAIEQGYEARMRAGVETWVGTRRAVDELRLPGSRALRRKAKRWHEQQQNGERPPVRVQKKGSAKNSDWQFCLEDCEKHAPETGSTPDVPAGAESEAEPGDRDDEAVDIGGLKAHL